MVEIDGFRILTDPLLRSHVLHLRRCSPAPPEANYASTRAVLISHAHPDHLDPSSLRRLGRDMPIVVPRDVGDFLRRRRFTEVTELTSGESVKLGPLTVRATPAVHDGRRLKVGRRVEALGYLIEGGSRVYFAGDTDLFEDMGKIGPGVDLALLPVSTWGSDVLEGHLDPPRAARAVTLIRPRIAVPIHWGTLRAPHLRCGDTHAPARAFERLVRERAPAVEPRVLDPGESTEIA